MARQDAINAAIKVYKQAEGWEASDEPPNIKHISEVLKANNYGSDEASSLAPEVYISLVKEHNKAKRNY